MLIGVVAMSDYYLMI